MKSCYLASFKGKEEARQYYQRFKQPTNRMVRVSIICSLPADLSTGFAEMQDWEFEERIHQVIQAW